MALKGEGDLRQEREAACESQQEQAEAPWVIRLSTSISKDSLVLYSRHISIVIIGDETHETVTSYTSRHVTSQYKNRCGRRNKKKCAILTCWPHGSPLPSECSPVSKADRALASMRTLAQNKRYTGCAWKLPNCSATNPLNVAEA